MNTRTFLPVASLLSAILILLPTGALAQKLPGNTNQSRATTLKSFIAGGSGNLIPSNTITAFIGGGEANTANSQAATIGGGILNTNSGFAATIGGGKRNTVSGGFGSPSSGDYATIGGGEENTASSKYATVPGGARGKATNTGSFVWSGDDSEETGSFADNTFTVRAEGGARFYTANGTNTYASLASGSGAWTAVSDRNAKENFMDVDASEVLAKVTAMPVKTWNYKTQVDGIRHIGPTAQDFRAAFGVGESDTGITTVDADGVAFAAIQGLVEELKERDKAMAARDRTIEELKAMNDELSRNIEAINKRLDSLPPTP